MYIGFFDLNFTGTMYIEILNYSPSVHFCKSIFNKNFGLVAFLGPNVSLALTLPKYHNKIFIVVFL